MRRLLARLRQELLRERTWSGARRSARTGRRSRAGVAMLLVISIIALLTVIVTEVVHSAGVRIQLAANQRDEAKAEALAQGGVQFYRLLLIASEQFDKSQIGAMIGSYLGINANALWMVIPTVSTDLLRLLVASDGDADDAQDMIAAGGLTDEQRLATTGDGKTFDTSLKRKFLAFDGDFTASVTDEDRLIYVGDLGKIVANTKGNPSAVPTMADLQMTPQGVMINGLMMPQDQAQFLRANSKDPWELIANLADWADPDDNRIYYGGRESALYDSLPNPYQPKNGPFDSVGEIRLVDGWQSDEIWERFGRHLTIYGDGKINVNTAQRRVLEALLYANIQPRPTTDAVGIIIQNINLLRSVPVAMGGGLFHQPQDFVRFVTQYAPGTVDPGLQNQVSVRSDVFRVHSHGVVGKAEVDIEVVYDFKNNPQGKVLSFRVL